MGWDAAERLRASERGVQVIVKDEESNERVRGQVIGKCGGVMESCRGDKGSRRV